MSTDSDWGFGVGAAYHFSNRLQVQMMLDWLNADYDATIMSGDVPPDPAFTVSGEYESLRRGSTCLRSWTVTSRPTCPRASAGALSIRMFRRPPQTGCWWDPWWGYICTTYQNTRDTDEFAYQAGVGVRWDVTAA